MTDTLNLQLPASLDSRLIIWHIVQPRLESHRCSSLKQNMPALLSFWMLCWYTNIIPHNHFFINQQLFQFTLFPLNPKGSIFRNSWTRKVSHLRRSAIWVFEDISYYLYMKKVKLLWYSPSMAVPLAVLISSAPGPQHYQRNTSLKS